MEESSSQRIFVTGVNGHIGNHIVRDLLEHGYCVKGSVRSLTDPSKVDHVLQHAKDLGVEDRLELVEGDVRDLDAVNRAFDRGGPVDGVIHFAGLKAVGESVANPLHYWDVNLNGSRVLATAMEQHHCRTLVGIFFASAKTITLTPKNLRAAALTAVPKPAAKFPPSPSSLPKCRSA